MEIICKARQSGKTTQLINKAAEDFLYIVCINRDEAYRVATLSEKIGKDIPYPITMDDFIKGRFHEIGINGFLIDNGEELIKKIARSVSVKAVTFTST